MNPLLPAGHQEVGGSESSLNLSSPSLHEIITADDEYVEFTKPINGQSDSGGQKQEKTKSTTSNDKLRLPFGTSSNPKLDSSLNNNHNNVETKISPTNQVNTVDESERERVQQLPYGGVPTIKLDWLDDGNNEFNLRDIHFHWGERRDNGSEHAIDGRRAAMEMHLVHIKHGLDKSAIGITSDSVTVIAVMIESHRKSNADFNPIVNELNRINATEDAQQIDYQSIYDLLPSNLDAFYTYSGSLTTPPCYQVVNWIVMAERLNMNAKQIEMFRQLYAPTTRHLDTHDHKHQSLTENNSGLSGDNEAQESDVLGGGQLLMMPNVRSLQPLNNRSILASFTKYGSRIEAAWLNNATNCSVFVQLWLALFCSAASSLLLRKRLLVMVDHTTTLGQTRATS